MRSCPICYNKKIKKICSRDKWIYLSCEKCKCWFLDYLNNKIDISTYYRKSFKYILDHQTKRRIRENSKKVISKLMELNPSGKTLLDIGSGHGYILNEAEKNSIKAFGIEPSKDLYMKSSKKYNVMNANLDNFIKVNRNKFDYICLIHVIEHLEEPWLINKDLHRLLNSNGIVYIETPNFDSWLRYIEKCNYTFLTPPDHIFIFSLKTLRRILDTKKWKIILVNTYSYREHLIGIIQKVKKYIADNKSVESREIIKANNKVGAGNNKNNRILKYFAPALTKLLNLFNKGSILSVFLKKT